MAARISALAFGLLRGLAGTLLGVLLFAAMLVLIPPRLTGLYYDCTQGIR